jgi:flagellar motor switch/type III secretory pathway protein FliN
VADGIEDMSTRPYKLINRTERGILTSRLSEGLRRWKTRYAPDETPGHCTLVLPGEDTAQIPEPREWLLGSRQSAPVLAVGLPEDWPRSLAGLVLTERQAASLDPAGQQLMRELGAGLLEELGQSVLDAALAIHPAESGLVWSRPTAPTFAGASADGRVLGLCRLGESLELLVMLWPEAVHRCLAPAAPRRAAAAPLEPLSRALQAEKVVLDGIAGEVELALEDLTTLAVGDVIKLNRKISEPLQVCVRGGGVVCAARLGAAKGRNALQLT